MNNPITQEQFKRLRAYAGAAANAQNRLRHLRIDDLRFGPDEQKIEELTARVTALEGIFERALNRRGFEVGDTVRILCAGPFRKQVGKITELAPYSKGFTVTWDEGLAHCIILEHQVAEIELVLQREVPRVEDRRTPAQRARGICVLCGADPSTWCPDCAACEAGCFDGHVDNDCTHENAPWKGTSS